MWATCGPHVTDTCEIQTTHVVHMWPACIHVGRLWYTWATWELHVSHMWTSCDDLRVLCMFSAQFNHTAPFIQCLLAQNVSKNRCKERTAVSYCGQRFAAVSPFFISLPIVYSWLLPGYKDIGPQAIVDLIICRNVSGAVSNRHRFVTASICAYYIPLVIIVAVLPKLIVLLIIVLSFYLFLFFVQ